MNKWFLIFAGVLLVVLVILVVRKQRHDGVVEDTHRAAVTLAAAADEVQFDLRGEACPPQNSAVYAEWTRRLADAKASSSRAAELLGSDDPNVQLLNAAISNQTHLLSERRITCLKRWGELLDAMRAGASHSK
jgi:hypothetical protein